VDPFHPPYLESQVVALGTNGTLVLEFDRPVWDDPANPHGLDILVFGNAGFVITNGDYSGGGITDGSLFGAGTGRTRISVSADGEVYYTLVSGELPAVDAWFPSDGAGDPRQPVNPALRASDLAGKDLAGLRALYGGSAGGAGYDLAWAQDERGSNVVLRAIRYVRFDQVEGVIQIDAVTAVAEPPSWWEDFSADPLARGWRSFGEPALFHWDAAVGQLEVTWDSSRTNSFFYRRLDTVLAKDDDFLLAFDLRLDDVAVGVHPLKPSTFQIAVGLVQLASVTQPDFYRGSGVADAGPRNVVEFDYFPDSGFGATISPTMVSSNNQFAVGFTFPAELAPGEWFQVMLRYRGGEQVLETSVSRGGKAFLPIETVRLSDFTSFTDFRLDALAIASYSDAGQDPQFSGSLLAHGTIDNVLVRTPGPLRVEVVKGEAEGRWQVQCLTRAHWLYTLERTLDFLGWTPVTVALPGTGAVMVFQDPGPVSPPAFYRVRTDRP
jgi:hypothetical protein